MAGPVGERRLAGPWNQPETEEIAPGLRGHATGNIAQLGGDGRAGSDIHDCRCGRAGTKGIGCDERDLVFALIERKRIIRSGPVFEVETWILEEQAGSCDRWRRAGCRNLGIVQGLPGYRQFCLELGRADGGTHIQTLPDGAIAHAGLEDGSLLSRVVVGCYFETDGSLAGTGLDVSGILRRLELLVREIAVWEVADGDSLSSQTPVSPDAIRLAQASDSRLVLVMLRAGTENVKVCFKFPEVAKSITQPDSAFVVVNCTLPEVAPAGIVETREPGKHYWWPTG